MIAASSLPREGRCRAISTGSDEPGGTDWYESKRMVYAKNGQAVSYVMGESWTWTGGGANPTSYDIAYAHEYRYDSGRQRYVDRVLNIPALMQGYVFADSELWTDYDGNEAYGDFTINGGTVTNIRSFEPGLARTADPLGLSGLPETDYYHTDMIGTTRLMTDPSGVGIEQAVYTAFGERVSGSIDGPEDRYGYAGAWGYQSDADFPFLHVGVRYFDPGTGRFVQRDPIGISGGSNVYEYVYSAPTFDTDPSGLGFWSRAARWGPIMGCAYIAEKVITVWIKPAIDDRNERIDREGDPDVAKPYDPDDPFGWVKRGEPKRQRRKWRREHPLPQHPRHPVPEPPCFSMFK